eukprot:4497871-Amphidinium_carterae.1
MRDPKIWHNAQPSGQVDWSSCVHGLVPNAQRELRVGGGHSPGTKTLSAQHLKVSDATSSDQPMKQLQEQRAEGVARIPARNWQSQGQRTDVGAAQRHTDVQAHN